MYIPEISTSLLRIISAEDAWQYLVLPKEQQADKFIFFAASENQANQKELSILLGKKVAFEIIETELLKALILKYYLSSQEHSTSKAATTISNSNAEDFILKLVLEAQENHSSDIHLEAFEQKCRIRFRIDGSLVERYTVPIEEYSGIVNKIKIKANLDISEKRLPQDGRFYVNFADKKIDLRVSALPSLFGEKIVLRLLNSSIIDINLESCGFDSKQLSLFRKAIHKPSGIVLISGPTGSGKTTTLYAALKELNTIHRNILTIEDPIEYTLYGINQIQLKESIGLTFAKALRTFLRQDPDIIMVGEIRDKETAEMAIRASLTGHLVLSTIHTNSAIGTINRLIDMEIPSFLISDTLVMSVAQRLVKILCPDCKQPLSKEEIELLPKFNDTSEKTIYKSVGCNLCYYTGYKGRKGIFELIEINDDLKKVIKNNSIEESTRKYDSLSSIALQLLHSGQTSFDDVSAYLN